MPRFLTKPTSFTNSVGNLHVAFVGVAGGGCGLAIVPADVEPGQIIHGMNTHGIAKGVDGCVYLIWRSTIFHHMRRTHAIFPKDTIAYKPSGISRPHRDFAQTFCQGKPGCHNIICNTLGHHDFEQLHNIGRAKEVQTKYLIGAICGA